MHDLIVYTRGVQLFRYACNCRCKVAKYFADPEGGPGGPDPLRFVIGGVLCGYMMSRRGVQKLFLSYFYNYFLARSARQYYT